MIIGNRNPSRGKIVGVDDAVEGQLFLPWYFQKEGGTKSRDVPATTLLLGSEVTSIDAKEVAPTSYAVDVRKAPGYDPKELQDSLRKHGQQQAAICVKHHFYDRCAPPHCLTTALIEDPTLEKVHVVEGHHRWRCLLQMRRQLLCKVFHLYTMDANPTAWDFDRHYRYSYGDDMWTAAVTGENRRPWFGWKSMNNGEGASKTELVRRCLDEARSIAGVKQFEFGADIGCAEGAYTVVLKDYCKEVVGYDHELGRIARGMMAVLGYGHEGVRFRWTSWDRIATTVPDVALLLSILHHVADPVALMHSFANAKALIVQVRVRHVYTPVNKGTIIGIHPLKEYEAMFREAGFAHKRIAIEKDEAYYVLHR
jgi:hypothetical protein